VINTLQFAQFDPISVTVNAGEVPVTDMLPLHPVPTADAVNAPANPDCETLSVAVCAVPEKLIAVPVVAGGGVAPEPAGAVPLPDVASPLWPVQFTINAAHVGPGVGVAVGVGDGDGLAVGVAVGVGAAVGDAVAVAVGVGVGVGVGEADGLDDAEADGSGDGEADPDGAAEGEADADDDAPGVGEAAPLGAADGDAVAVAGAGGGVPVVTENTTSPYADPPWSV
jgi:hypothetical protein